MLYHYFQAYPQYSPYGAALLPLAKYGDLGVELFFIISGFVITLSLTERPGPLRFALKRLARLWLSTGGLFPHHVCFCAQRWQRFHPRHTWRSEWLCGLLDVHIAALLAQRLWVRWLR
ncbi:hypothetical protein L0Z66_12740 [Phaeobacter sp. BS34]